jgi:BirA family biotin operon repressor/biotin-[acetyl-CoA-carboxylase] ligase
VENRGPTDWQDTKKYLRPDTALGCVIHSAPETPSTQDEAKEAARAGAPHGAGFVTDAQTSGRGRRGRNWTASPGADLTFSLVMRPAAGAGYAHMLNLAAALAARDALEEILPETGAPVGVKWPNDVLVNGRKICGIICEGSVMGRDLAYAVLGIGVNVNGAPERLAATDSPDRPQTTSVLAELGRKLYLPKLLADVLTRLELFSGMVDSAQGRAELIGIYRRRCVTIGRSVRVISDDGEYIGDALGVDEDGALIHMDACGVRRTFRAADVVHAAME